MFGLASQRAHNRVITERDYRGPTFGPFDAAIEGMRRLQPRLRTPLYGVLGNHDTIRMVPDLEDMGVRVLLNECEPISRGKDRIFLAGIDDAHYFRVDNIEKAAASIPHEGFSILLSHTPEIYRQAAHAGFDLLLSGHTHGGQICLPGGIPITLDSVLPRYMGSGAWTYHNTAGYTCRIVCRCRADQLSAGDHSSSPPMRLRSRQYGRSRTCSLNSRRESRSSPTIKSTVPTKISAIVRGRIKLQASSGRSDSGI
jgi:hypothetical protein